MVVKLTIVHKSINQLINGGPPCNNTTDAMNVFHIYILEQC
jgi:hypothetical protein